MNTARAAAAFMLMFNIIEEKKKPKRKVRWWMKELYRRRMQCGNRLMRDMTFEVVEDTVKNVTRMSLSDFEHITSFIEPSVKKMDTQFRTPELAFYFVTYVLPCVHAYTFVMVISTF
jgi:hypothetical protein